LMVSDMNFSIRKKGRAMNSLSKGKQLKSTNIAGSRYKSNEAITNQKLSQKPAPFSHEKKNQEVVACLELKILGALKFVFLEQLKKRGKSFHVFKLGGIIRTSYLLYCKSSRNWKAMLYRNLRVNPDQLTFLLFFSDVKCSSLRNSYSLNHDNTNFHALQALSQHLSKVNSSKSHEKTRFFFLKFSSLKKKNFKPK
jgi:hypothetical protein